MIDEQNETRQRASAPSQHSTALVTHVPDPSILRCRFRRLARSRNATPAGRKGSAEYRSKLIPTCKLAGSRNDIELYANAAIIKPLAGEVRFASTPYRSAKMDSSCARSPSSPIRIACQRLTILRISLTIFWVWTAILRTSSYPLTIYVGRAALTTQAYLAHRSNL
jgi:hypothetical protein